MFSDNKVANEEIVTERKLVYSVRLPFQFIEFDNTNIINILRCQVSPCKKENAMDVAFEIKFNPETRVFTVKNLGVEDAAAKMIVKFSREIPCDLKETIKINNISTIYRSENGITIESDLKLALAKGTGESFVTKNLGIGDSIELTYSDGIVLNNKQVISFDSYSMNVDSNNEPSPWDIDWEW